MQPLVLRVECKSLFSPFSRQNHLFSSEAATRVLFSPFLLQFKTLKLRGNVVRTFFGESDFYCANVFFVQSSVPTMFLQFFANGRVTNGRVPPFPISAGGKNTVSKNTVFTTPPLWPLKRFYRTPVKGSSEPQTGFYIEPFASNPPPPPPFQVALLTKPSLSFELWVFSSHLWAFLRSVLASFSEAQQKGKPRKRRKPLKNFRVAESMAKKFVTKSLAISVWIFWPFLPRNPHIFLCCALKFICGPRVGARG